MIGDPIPFPEARMTTAILTIDLGKFNSVLCWYEPATKATEFRTIKTTPELLRKELTRQPVAQSCSKRVPKPVGFTICARN